MTTRVWYMLGNRPCRRMELPLGLTGSGNCEPHLIRFWWYLYFDDYGQ